MTVTALLAVFAGLLGVAVGSFLNVVVHRVPLGLSLLRPPSMCPSCGVGIRPQDNVPIVSYLLLRARCRACRASISVRYPLVEAGTAALWVACVLRFERLEAAAFVAVTASVLGALALIDLEHRRIPNVVVLPATAGALLWVVGLSAASSRWDIALRSVTSGAGLFTLLLVIALASGGMGFGDVKLGALVGAAAGRFGIGVAVAATLAGFVLGGLVAVVLLATGRRGRKDALPFGPALAAGTIAAVFAGESTVRAWLGL